MNFGTKGCMYNCGDECTGECIKVETKTKMSKEEIERCYENYSKEYEKDNSIGSILLVKRHNFAGKKIYRKLTIEMFEGIMDSDENFRNKWTLKPKQR